LRNSFIGSSAVFRRKGTTAFKAVVLSCTVLIDFERASLRIEPKDIDELIHGLGPDLRLGNIKIALVSSPEIGESEQLKVLSDSLCREDLKAAVFANANEAVGWLVSPV
jgi:hypothetical protein